MTVEDPKNQLSTSLFDLSAALPDFELWIAFADYVNATPPLHNLAVGMAVLQGTDAADNFHRKRLKFWLFRRKPPDL